MNKIEKAERAIKIHKYVLTSLPIFIVSSLFAMIFGWSFYSMITERGGARGHGYIYYDIPKTFFIVLNFIIFILTAFLSIFQIFNVIILKQNIYKEVV